MNNRNNEALQRYIAQNLSGLNVAPQRPPATPLGTGIAGMGGSAPVAQPSPLPPRNLGIAEFEGSSTPQLPQLSRNGKRIEIGPHLVQNPPPDAGIAAQLGGLFGSQSFSWGPRRPPLGQEPLVQSTNSADFEQFMDELMNSGKNEDGSRVTRDMTLEQWAKRADRWENVMAHPIPPPMDFETGSVLGFPDYRPNSMDRTGSSSWLGRQNNWMLTPEERGAVADEFYRENPWLVTPRGNRLSKDLPRDVQDAIKKDYLLKKWLEQNT